MTRSLRSLELARITSPSVLDAPAVGAGLGLSVVDADECTTPLLEAIQ